MAHEVFKRVGLNYGEVVKECLRKAQIAPMNLPSVLIRPPGQLSRSGGGIGRRAGLRILWGNPWGFDSPLEHSSFRLEP